MAGWRTALLAVSLITILSRPCSGNLLNLAHPVIEESNDEVVRKWSELDKGFRSLVGQGVQMALPQLVRAGTEIEIGAECQASLFQLMIGFRSMKPWTFYMLDSWGKVPSGILSGSISDLGAYDECLSVKGPNDQFQGQYCALEIRPPIPPKPKQFRIDEMLKPLDRLNDTLSPGIDFMRHQAAIFYFLSFRIGACVPSTCKVEDMRKMTEHFGSMVNMNIQVPRCEIREDTKFETDQIVMLSIVSLLIALCLIGTAVDVFKRTDLALNVEDGPTTERRILVKAQALLTKMSLSFSISRNLKSLFNTSGSSLSVLHGIKFLSITWVIVGHTYLYVNWQLLRDLTKARSIIRNFAFQAVANAFVAVDTFFFISGLLVSYMTIRYVDKNGIKAFNIPMAFIRRLWRYLPATAMMVGLTVLLPLLGSGPLWHETIDVLVNACRINWWANLIFVNNIYYTPDACQPTTWYTACDIQLFILAMIFLFILFRHPKASYAVLLMMIVCSVLLSMGINAWQNLPPAILLISPDPEGVFDYWYYSHFLPHVHLASYAVGLGVGYLLVRHSDIKIKRNLRILGWMTAFILCTSTLYGVYSWNAVARHTQTAMLAYAGLHRLAWILGVGWMTFMCATGFGGPIATFLSWRGFIPLSRLTFLAYLWHGTIIWVYIGNMEAAIKTSHIVIVWMYLGHLVATFFLATVLHLVYEAPFAHLGRMVFGPHEKKPNATIPVVTKQVASGQNGTVRESFTYKL